MCTSPSQLEADMCVYCHQVEFEEMEREAQEKKRQIDFLMGQRQRCLPVSTSSKHTQKSALTPKQVKKQRGALAGRIVQETLENFKSLDRRLSTHFN